MYIVNHVCINTAHVQHMHEKSDMRRCGGEKRIYSIEDFGRKDFDLGMCSFATNPFC